MSRAIPTCRPSPIQVGGLAPRRQERGPLPSRANPAASRASEAHPLSEFLRPLPRRVKHPQDFHRLTAYPVGHEVRCSRNHQLSRPCNSPCPAHGWILLQNIHGPQNPQHYPPSRRRVVHPNVLRLCVQVGQRSPQPSNSHGESTSSPAALLRSRLQSLLGSPLPALWESLQFST